MGQDVHALREIAGGRVRAYFADGACEKGDVLVGADESKSKVREQRLPLLHRDDLDIVIICGQYPMTEAVPEELPTLMKDCSLNNIVSYGKGMDVSEFLALEDRRAE